MLELIELTVCFSFSFGFASSSSSSSSFHGHVFVEQNRHVRLVSIRPVSVFLDLWINDRYVHVEIRSTLKLIFTLFSARRVIITDCYCQPTSIEYARSIIFFIEFSRTSIGHIVHKNIRRFVHQCVSIVLFVL
jgi:hypothetical protein